MKTDHKQIISISIIISILPYQMLSGTLYYMYTYYTWPLLQR